MYKVRSGFHATSKNKD